MKQINTPTLSALCLSITTLSSQAALPCQWTVDLAAQPPQVFTLQRPRGETYDIEAVLKNHGKPFAPAITNARIYWQTNGMENLYWSAPASVTGNVLRASWLPSMDPGATTVRGFIGDPGRIYAAAFQFRFTSSPGATPNELPLPVPTIDFSKVTVLNPPWPAGGVGTNDVVDIVRKTVAGSARYLPKYLWIYDCADSYPDDAAWYYAQPQDYGSCSAVRDGGFLYRNYDWKFDEAAEFVVRMSAGPGRFASVGVANCGTNLTEQFVASGRPSRYYKCLPGRAVDGINEHGVVCEVNVVDGEVDPDEWSGGGDLHPLAAVRWVLDHATNALHAAKFLKENIKFPPGWRQNFHWMIADERGTWVVENGDYHAATGRVVMTNFPLYPAAVFGAGWERYVLLTNSTESITNAWYTRAYSDKTEWLSEFHDREEMNAAKIAWDNGMGKESHRGQHDGDKWWWQTVHTSVYDITNRTLRVAVQEVDDWYVFQVPSAGGVKPEAVREIVEPMIENATVQLSSQLSQLSRDKRDKDDLDVYSGTNVVGRIATTGEVASAVSSHHDDTKLDSRNPADPDVGRVEWGEDGRLNVSGGLNATSIETLSIGGLLGLSIDVSGVPPDYQNWNVLKLDFGMGEFTRLQDSLDDKADDADLEPVRTDAANALAFSRATYDYMNGNTNAWFSGTNYVVGADSTNRTHFAFEDGMDLERVPCSMALWEIRDGERRCVWDQRDWPTWYWNFKAEQLSNVLARVTGDLAEEVSTNCMKRGWAKYTAVRGLDNPDPSTLWIDTPKVQLMAGHQWEKVVETGGAGYWTITGNGIELSQQDAESTFLTIKDFEGNACLTFRKTSSYLVYCECGTDITRNFYDAQGRVVFHLTTDVQPTAEFSTTLELDSFVEQDEDGCPASCEWTGSAGNWDCHFVLKPGITSAACFARFKVMREGENVVEHTVPIKINGGIVFEQNGQTLKCKPVAQGTSVGSTVNWVIAQ